MILRLAALCLLLAASASAQPTYRFDHFGTDRGLSQSMVTAITQDRQGFLWIGTDDGLNRFDGHTFTVYRHALEDPTTLPGSRISSLYIDDEGTLWVGTMSGLARFDRSTETFHVPPGAPGDASSRCAPDVTSIAPGPDGSLWTGIYSGGLCRIAPDRRSAEPVHVEPDDGTGRARVYALRLDETGTPWAQTGSGSDRSLLGCRVATGPARCESRTDFVQRVPGSPSLVAEGVIPMALQDRGGGSRLSLADMTHVSTRERHLLALNDDRVWMATEDQGIAEAHLQTGEVSWIRHAPDDPRSLSSSSIRVLFQDREGSVWVGTTSGLSRWQPPDPARFVTVRRGPPEAGGLADERVSGIAARRDGSVWISTRDGLHTLDPETGRVSILRRPDPDATYGNAFWHLFEDSSGTLWVGTKRRGLLRLGAGGDRLLLEPAFAEISEFGPQIDRMQIRHVAEDSAGRLWVGTGTGFAVRTPEEGWTPFLDLGPDRLLPSGRVNVFYEDRGGTLWVGTDAGLCRLSEGAEVPEDIRFRCYRHSRTDPQSLGADVVWALAEDGLGRLWIGTVGGGLARYIPRTDTFVRLTTQDGLPNNTVYGLVADHSGVLWATTNAGLARVDPLTRGVRTYTTAHGLPGNEFDFMAYDVALDGRVYVGGPHGLVSFDPAEMTATPEAAPVALTSVHVFDARIPGLLASGDTLRLRHDQNFFRLGFAALDFRTPERSRYRYRLTGYEPEWRQTSDSAPEASYTRVPPGNYVFEVASLDAAAQPNAPMRLHVEIVPAFWQTLAFQGGMVALALALGLVGVGRVVGNRRRDAAREDAEATELKRRVAEGRDRERLRIARELHDGPVQDLYRLGHDLDRLRLRGDAAPTTLLGARQQVTTVATNLREVLATLRPPIIPHLGLPAALESLARRIRRRHPGLDVRLDLDTHAARALPADAQNALYRVTQEALTNVAKHAEARTAQVTLRRAENGTELIVRDDGRGFVCPPLLLDLARADHFGLVGTAERLDVIGGRLVVETSPGAGTTIRAWLPEGRAE
ncbi:MAG: two-component regulator propeller domain-containing protein [Bacteroidota bacterium]